MLRTVSRWMWVVVLSGLSLGTLACSREAAPVEPADAGGVVVESLPALDQGSADGGAGRDAASAALLLEDMPGESPPAVPAAADEREDDALAREGAALEFAFPHEDPAPVDHLGLARAHQQSGDHAGAMLEAEKALYDDPANFSAAMLLGESAQASGRPQLAADAWLFAASLRMDEDEPWLRLAGMTFARGDLVEAEQLVLRALRLRPDRALSHNLRGRIWLARSHWERAIACFQRALELAPASLHVRNNLGLALLRKRDFQRAVEVLEPLGGAERATAYMLNNLGLAYEGLGRLPEASATYRRALDREPRYLKAQLNLARMTELAQRNEAAGSGE